ncbi:hypothetical protein C5O80_37535 [Burkholderia sp. SRS-46]|nr:hypothetical protein C5O80_37535 [Burkholderia sp. SRS-46]
MTIGRGVKQDPGRGAGESSEAHNATDEHTVRPAPTLDNTRTSNCAPKPTVPDLASYLFMLVMMVLALTLKLLGALLAGLLVYQLIQTIVPRLGQRLSGQSARWFAVAIVPVIVIGSLTGVTLAVIEHVESNVTSLQKLLDPLAGSFDQARARLPLWASPYLPTSATEMETKLMGLARQHATQLAEGGTDAMRGLVQVLIGVILGTVVAASAPRHPRRLPVAAALTTRLTRFADAFRRIVFAQLKISAINASFTGLYLLVALPLFHSRLPLSKTLVVLAFIVGLLPVIGNLISNTLIVIISLTAGIGVAIASLIFLIVIHKLEYLLNARIVGGQIAAKAWELLVAMLVMEAAFGMAGVIAAPIYYAYVKRELVLAGLI